MSTDTTTVPADTAPMQVAINDVGTGDDFLAAIDKTIKYFNDGDMSRGPSSRSIVMRSCSISVTRPRA